MRRATQGAGPISVHEPLDVSSPELHPDYPLRLPRRPILRLGPAHSGPTTAAITRIPIRPNDSNLMRQHDGRPLGQQIILGGQITDPDGEPLAGTLLEIYQCNASGAYVDRFDPGEKPLDPNFTGSGRCLTDGQGHYRFDTIRPAAYAGPAGTGVPFRPAHIHVSLIGPDLSNRLVTQVYFEDDPFFERDFVIAGMHDPDPEARRRLLARFDESLTEIGGPDAAIGYRWDVVLGGARATPMEW